MTSPDPLAEATTVAEAAARLAATPWGEVPGPEAVEVATAIAGARGLLDAALLGVTEQLEATSAAQELGWATTKDFLTHLTGGHQGSGGGLVRAAEQLRELPAVREALKTGRVTLPQARVIASQVQRLPRHPELRSAVADRMLALVDEHGHNATALQTAFADVVREIDPEGLAVAADLLRDKTERGAHHARHLSFAEDGLGGVRVRGYGTIEDAERIKSVLLPLAAPQVTEPGSCGGASGHGRPMFDEDGRATTVPCPTAGCPHDGRDPRQPDARLWDALVDACDQLRATDTLPRDHGSLPRVVVTIDHASLSQAVIDADRAAEGRTGSDTRLSPQSVRRLACDAEILPAVLGSESQVLDVGRAQRLVTPGLWSALLVRDRHCVFPGCTRLPLACDAHHVVHWADGGETKLDNLALLCRHHHTLTHRTPWTLHIDSGTGRPVWTPPPRLTRTTMEGRMSYVPARSPHPPGAPPPLVA